MRKTQGIILSSTAQTAMCTQEHADLYTHAYMNMYIQQTTIRTWCRQNPLLIMPHNNQSCVYSLLSQHRSSRQWQEKGHPGPEM